LFRPNYARAGMLPGIEVGGFVFLTGLRRVGAVVENQVFPEML